MSRDRLRPTEINGKNGAIATGDDALRNSRDQGMQPLTERVLSRRDILKA